MNASAFLVLFLFATVPVLEATTPYYHAVQFGRTLRRLFSPRIPFGLKVLGVGKHLLLAPITLPLAVAAKTAGAGIIAAPALAGAAIGAPVGAIAGAHAGAITGAIKGAALGKAVLVTKLALAGKAAAIGAKIALAPVVIGAKVKAVILAKKLAILSKKAAIAGKLLTKVAAKKAKAASHIKGLGLSVKSKIKGALATVATKKVVQTREQIQVPSAPAIFDTQYVLNTPLTGPRFGRLHLTTGAAN